jgi:hypothetical protein
VCKTSLYYAAHGWLNDLLSGEMMMEDTYKSGVWTQQVVSKLSKMNPPAEIWVGAYAQTVRVANWLPNWGPRAMVRDTVKLGVVEKKVRRYGREKVIADAYGTAK